MQLQMFPKRILDELGILGGVTSARAVRASDGLTYAVKDETAGVPSVRASEFLWLSVAKAIGLPSATPEIFLEGVDRHIVGTRLEHAAVGKDHSSCLFHLLSGTVHDGGRFLSRLFAFDLFCGNWDRHPGNYLVIEDAGALVVLAIDYSHVEVNTGLLSIDPTLVACATRGWFPVVVKPYGPDPAAATETVDRLAQLPTETIEAILKGMPEDWMSLSEREAVCVWWSSGARADRTNEIKKGLVNGVYI